MTSLLVNHVLLLLLPVGVPLASELLNVDDLVSFFNLLLELFDLSEFHSFDFFVFFNVLFLKMLEFTLELLELESDSTELVGKVFVLLLKILVSRFELLFEVDVPGLQCSGLGPEISLQLEIFLLFGIEHLQVVL